MSSEPEDAGAGAGRDCRAAKQWWAPYVGVLLMAVAIGLLVFVFVLLHAEEISRVLRASGT